MPALSPRMIFAAVLCAVGLGAFSNTLAAEAKLTLEPNEIVLHSADETAQVLATLQTADGQTRDVTGSSVFALRTPGVVEAQAGRLTPQGDGTCEVEVQVTDAGQTLSGVVRVTVVGFHEPRTINFRRDLEPVFSKYGCNSGGCHGKLVGQNGFRLSLFAFDPLADYNSLAKESRGRRVFPAAPDESLLLAKVSGRAPHGGGRRLDVGTPAYNLVRRWIEQGAPWGDDDPAKLVRIDVAPKQRVLAKFDRQQLRVVAHFSDGRTKDITAEAEYRSQRAEVAAVDAEGLVTTRDGAGEGTVLVRYLGEVDIARVMVPFRQQVSDGEFAHFQPANVVDQLTLKKWHTLGIVPSDTTADQEFVRRAYVDAIGLLPEPAEVRAFLADNSADKRAKLIDHLLARPEFVDYWALQLGDLLQNRKERDHDVRGAKNVRMLHEWLRQQLASARPWNEMVREVLTVKGSSFDNPAVGYFVVNVGEAQTAEATELISSAAQAFLGTRLGCAKCHNHPLERYTQDDYYHFAAFFSRVKLERRAPQQGATTLLVSAHDANQNTKPIGVSQPRTGQFMAPQTLGRQPVAVEPGDDPRIKLAAWITDPSNEMFSGAMVNRLCRHFFGYGLVEPVDDLRATNPPTNPELWQALSREFVEHKFDLRHVMRLIMNSRTYQLSSTTRADNAGDMQFYSHYFARRLPAEVLLDAVSRSTGVPDSFPGYPLGVRAGQLADPSVNSYFLSLFGRSNRTTACACEKQGDVTLPQLLHLQNGDSVVQKIRDGRGRLWKSLEAKTETEAIVDELFLAALSRLPHDAEKQAVAASLAAGPREEVLTDLFWALLNSKEFGFNH